MSSATFHGLGADALAKTISSMWTSWDAGKNKWKSRVAEVVQYIYATSTEETTNRSNGWSHTTHIPKLTQIYDNLSANYADALFGSRQWFDFSPANEEAASADNTRNIVAYLQTKHDLAETVLEMRKCLDDWTRTGNAFGMLSYVREYAPSITDADGQPVIAYEGPKLERISPYDIVFDYTAADFNKSPKIIRKITNMGDFLAQYEDNGDILRWDEEVVAKMVSMRQGVTGRKQAEVNKHIQFQSDGFSNAYDYFTSGTVEVLEFYGDIFDAVSGEFHRRRKITVVDRHWILASEEVKTASGHPLIFHVGWRKRPDNLWAMGPLDNLVGMQYLIDHLENARADAFDKMLTPDRVHVGNVQVEEEGPVTNYYIPDGEGSVSNIAPDATVLQADFQIQVKEAQMEAYAGAPREAMGMRSPGEKTKYEVMQLQNAATRLFQHKIDDFEKQFVEPVLNGELELIVRYLDVADQARTFDDDLGIYQFLEITQDDLKASGKLRARGASHFRQKAVMVQELREFQNQLNSDPAMQVHVPAKRLTQLVVEALGFEKFGLYEPYARIAEQVEAQNRTSAAQSEIANNEGAAELIAGGIQ